MEAAGDLHLRVPEDVSIAGFDGNRLGQMLRPRLTTIKQDTKRMGMQAALYLIDRIENPRTAGSETEPEAAEVPAQLTALEFDLAEQEARLSEAVSLIDGAGKAKVVLSVRGGVQRELASEAGETLIVSTGGGAQAPVELRYTYPEYQGALVLCEGAHQAQVRLAVTEALRAVTGAVVVVLLPADVPADWTGSVAAAVPLTGPEFGSYAPEDVTWLLKDLRDAQLEAPTAEREAAIQSGGANYAESLPMEYLPSAQYQDLYAEALVRSAPRVAAAVGTVTEMALAARNREPVLVSLARAGTPIGILMRRWAQRMHGLDLPHYTMSIVRGVGMDETALRYLAARYDPARILFVDGWTGKGAITRELTAALDKFEASDGVRFSAQLAVLADPGHSVELFGTREDYLIPSACLNSTVSGLVSRTVYNKDLIGPEDFHGAKFYAHLASADVSREFLAAVEAQFDDVRADAVALAAELAGTDRTPTWVGWQAVERLSEEYGIHNVNLVKPGVGETTRVLLRRVPWKVLVHPDARTEVAHVLLLAEQRGVPVEEVPDLPFSCVGLIHPRFTAGAVGADGKAAAAGNGAAVGADA